MYIENKYKQLTVIFNSQERQAHLREPRKPILFLFLSLECVADLDHQARRLFSSHFWPLFEARIIFDAAGAVAKIGLSLKPIHHN